MYNVACLDSINFNQMAYSSRIYEIRGCRLPDLQIEKVVPGEPILFLEIMSDRALLSRIISIRRIEVVKSTATRFLIYVIRVSHNRRYITFPMKRMPGWLRFTKDDLAPLLKSEHYEQESDLHRLLTG
jgi:hypothetical protein